MRCEFTADICLFACLQRNTSLCQCYVCKDWPFFPELSSWLCQKLTRTYVSVFISGPFILFRGTTRPVSCQYHTFFITVHLGNRKGGSSKVVLWQNCFASSRSFAISISSLESAGRFAQKAYLHFVWDCTEPIDQSREN